jgi:DNA repair exonuclease SbcCD ATPase subunit
MNINDVSRLKYENKGLKEALNKLTIEYNDYRNECDEIFKEYEETIQLLSDSLNNIKIENSKYNKEKEEIKKDNERINKELEKSRGKNKEKIRELEILTNKYEQLQSQFKSINKKETTLKSKLVTLETDNDHYINKIHQYEEEVTDLKESLENYIENLITVQTDFDDYKNKKEEEIERLKKQLQEEKSNVRVLMLKNKNDNNVNKANEYNETLKKEDRKLSCSEDIEDDLNEKKSSSKMIKTLINEDDEKEHEKLLELGRTRSNRAMTMQKSSYNFGEIISNLRQRRERIAIFHNKIKNDSTKIK